MQERNENMQKTALQIWLSRREVDALNQMVCEKGKKKYFIVREAIVRLLTAEGYLPESN